MICAWLSAVIPSLRCDCNGGIIWHDDLSFFFVCFLFKKPVKLYPDYLHSDILTKQDTETCGNIYYVDYILKAAR